MAIETHIELEVLICTYGADGIKHVAQCKHPEIPEVSYLVSWQASDGIDVPYALQREDFKIFRTDSKGLSKNRNHAFSKSTAPFLLISDDDLDYTEKGLKSVIESFHKNPNADIITFRYDSIHNKKQYPYKKVSLQYPSKGYFITSFEIALKSDSIVGKKWFNENFGIGATFPSGEEDVFIKDCLNADMIGIYLPITIVRHEGTTTSERNQMLASRPQTKGAVFLHLHPHDWPLRMISHALREIPLWRKGMVPSPLSYCINWLKGAFRAKKMKIFPTPDYSAKYLSHE